MNTWTINLLFRPPWPPRNSQAPKTISLKLSTTDPKCYIFLESLGPDLHPPTLWSSSDQNGPVTRHTGGEVCRFAIFFFYISIFFSLFSLLQFLDVTFWLKPQKCYIYSENSWSLLLYGTIRKNITYINFGVIKITNTITNFWQTLAVKYMFCIIGHN